MAPATWSPPEFLFYQHPDGSVVAVDRSGVPLASPPPLQVSTTGGVTSVTDPWGNTITKYELPEFTVHLVTQDPFGLNAKTVAVAVDQNGKPIPLINELEVTFDDPVNDIAGVIMPDGSKATVAQYEGHSDFFVHIEASSQDLSHGTVTHEMVAVDANGVPLPVQPVLGGDPTDPSSIWAQWGTGTPVSPSVYQFPEFSVHLVSQGIPGLSAPKLAPVAVDANGVPLVTQPQLHLDPIDPTKVTATLPDGTTIEPPAYQFPEFSVYVHSTTPMGHGAPNYVAVAVGAEGMPLPIQPYMEVDPTDPAKVTATFADFTTYEPTPYHLSKDFYVHVVASGPPSGQGAQTFEAVAVGADGVPLPLQPHLEVDPFDPTRVTATFSDGTTYEPPNLYPPPGPPPEQWPPPATEASEESSPEDDDEADQTGSGEVAATEPSEARAELDEEPLAPTPQAEVEEWAAGREDILVAGLVEPAAPATIDREETPSGAVLEEAPAPAGPVAEQTRFDVRELETEPTRLDEASDLVTSTLADEQIAEAIPIVDAGSRHLVEPFVAAEEPGTATRETESELAAGAAPEADVERVPGTTVEGIAAETVPETAGEPVEEVAIETAAEGAIEPAPEVTIETAADVAIESAPDVAVEPVTAPLEVEPVEDTTSSGAAEEVWEDDA